MTPQELRIRHLNEHKLHHNSKDALSTVCDYGSETETINHFFLRCPFFRKERQKLLNGLFEIDLFLRNLTKELLLGILLYGSDKCKGNVNKKKLLRTINFIRTI